MNDLNIKSWLAFTILSLSVAFASLATYVLIPKHLSQESVITLPNGDKYYMPSGSEFTYTESSSDIKELVKSTDIDNVGGSMKGDKVKGSVSLAPIDFLNGKAYTKGSAEQFNNGVKIACLLIGAIFIAAGITMCCFGLLQIGIGAGVTGILLIVLALIAEALATVVIVGGIMICAVIAYLIYKHYIAKQNSAVLTTIVGAVEDAGTNAQPVKDAIASAADDAGVNVKKVVSNIKTKLGI